MTIVIVLIMLSVTERSPAAAAAEASVRAATASRRDPSGVTSGVVGVTLRQVRDTGEVTPRVALVTLRQVGVASVWLRQSHHGVTGHVYMGQIGEEEVCAVAGEVGNTGGCERCVHLVLHWGGEGGVGVFTRYSIIRGHNNEHDGLFKQYDVCAS